MSAPLDALYEQIDTAVLDDLTQFCWGLDIAHQAGAVRMLTYVLMKRSAQRRERARGPVKPAKGVKTSA